MEDNIKPYPKYKEIEVPWLPTIPEHWIFDKVKHCFSERVEKGYPNEPLLSSTQTRGVIPQSLYGNRVVSALKDFHLLKLVEVDDFVISLRSFQGGIEYAHYRGIISPAYTVMKANDKIKTPYFRYLAKSVDFIQLLQTCVTGIREGQNIDYKLLKKNYLPIPPSTEQIQIANFLDYKVALINKFIKHKKKEILLLKEQKQAEINQAVTCGVNPNAKMKDSGISWIGEIPAHWELMRLKDIFHSNTESLSNSTYSETEISYLDISSVGFGVLKREPEIYLFKKAPSRARRIVHEGDIIISTVRTYLKSLCYITDSLSKCIVSTGFSVLSPYKEYNSKYLSYVLSVNYFIENVIKNSYGISYPAINDDKLMSLKIAITTDIIEQQKIVDHITIIEERINRGIAAIEKEIILIKDYKASLISDVVTGKIDVRNVAVEKIEDVPEEEIEEGDETEDLEKSEE